MPSQILQLCFCSRFNDQSPPLVFDNLSEPKTLVQLVGDAVLTEFDVSEDGTLKVQFNESWVVAAQIEIIVETDKDVVADLTVYGCESGTSAHSLQ